MDGPRAEVAARRRAGRGRRGRRRRARRRVEAALPRRCSLVLSLSSRDRHSPPAPASPGALSAAPRRRLDPLAPLGRRADGTAPGPEGLFGAPAAAPPPRRRRRFSARCVWAVARPRHTSPRASRAARASRAFSRIDSQNRRTPPLPSSLSSVPRYVKPREVTAIRGVDVAQTIRLADRADPRVDQLVYFGAGRANNFLRRSARAALRERDGEPARIDFTFVSRAARARAPSPRGWSSGPGPPRAPPVRPRVRRRRRRARAVPRAVPPARRRGEGLPRHVVRLRPAARLEGQQGHHVHLRARRGRGGRRRARGRLLSDT